MAEDKDYFYSGVLILKNNCLFENHDIAHSCLVSFQFIYRNLKSAERKAADYCLHNPELVMNLPISEVATQAGCSEATFVRLAKRLGYSGYPELREKILRKEGEGVTSFLGISPDATVETIVTNVFKSCVLYIQDSFDAIDFSNFNRAVDYVSKASRLMFVAAGDANFTASSGAQKFMRIGYRVTSSTDFDTQLVNLSQMTAEDVVVCISHSGRTKSVCDIAKTAHDYGIKVVTITNFPVSPLAKLSDVILLTASFAYDTMDEILVKRVPALCLLDALYMCVCINQKAQDEAIAERSNMFLSLNKL